MDNEIILLFVSCALSAFAIISMVYCYSLHPLMGFAVVDTDVKKQLKNVSHLQNNKVRGNI